MATCNDGYVTIVQISCLFCVQFISLSIFFCFLFFVFSDGIFRILFEEVDESDVGIIKFPSFNGDGGMEEYRCRISVHFIISTLNHL